MYLYSFHITPEELRLRLMNHSITHLVDAVLDTSLKTPPKTHSVIWREHI